jgi:4-amino-4-deoxy-L-arabinose transferase-like glycosyltransferase
MLFAALAPALVSRSSNVMVDNFATFFVALAIYFSVRLQAGATELTQGRWRYALGAGAAAGFAFTSKYPAGAVLVAVMIAIVQSRARSRAMLIAAALFAFAVAAALAMPALFLSPAEVVRNWLYLAQSYDTLHSASYLAAALSSAELGIPLTLAGLLGFIVMFRGEPAARRAATVWVAFALILLSGLVWSSFQPFRNLLPIVPLVCAGAAMAIDWLRARSLLFIDRRRSGCRLLSRLRSCSPALWLWQVGGTSSSAHRLWIRECVRSIG